MEIRSITTFMHPGQPLDTKRLKPVKQFIARSKPVFEGAGYPVQTIRIATPPFPKLMPAGSAEALRRYVLALETAVSEMGAEYLSLGPAVPDHLESYSVIPELLAETDTVFFSGFIANGGQGISLPAVRACADLIKELAVLEANGFGNLYFAALANVPPGAPFFPAAYHQEGPPAFGVALEAADLAVQAFGAASSLNEARSNLVRSIEGHAAALTQLGKHLAQEHHLRFLGLDFTLAPYPDEARSIGGALESLGIPALGQHGSLAAAAFLADTLDRARFLRTGFNGLMLPVLEDARLAQRAGEGILTVRDLLSYSAVCGTGLDTIPLPGDTPAEALAALLLDLAALSQRLAKPLTARLMPIPGKIAGEPTGFDFPYFANSRVMALEAAPLKHVFTGNESFDLGSRP